VRTPDGARDLLEHRNDEARHWLAIAATIVLALVAAVILVVVRRPKPPSEMIIVYTAGPFDVVETDSMVTFPIEHALGSLAGVAHVQSTSREGVSVVTLKLAPGADLFAVEQAVIAAIPRNTLPDELQPPLVTHVWQFEDRFVWLDANTDMLEFRGRLESVPNVRGVSACGDRHSEVSVVVDPPRLTAHGLVVHDVIAALEFGPLLSFKRGPVADIPTTPIKNGILVRDVARVDTTPVQKCRATRAGAEGILASVSVGTDHTTSDPAIRKSGVAFGLEHDAFRVEFPNAKGLTAADVDAVIRAAGATDVLVEESDGVVSAAVGVAKDACAVARESEKRLIVRTAVHVRACGLDDDARSMRIVGSDLDALIDAANRALPIAGGEKGVWGAFVEGAEKRTTRRVEVDRAHTASFERREILELANDGVDVGSTDKWERIVVRLPPGADLGPVRVTNEARPVEIDHLDMQRVVRVWLAAEDAPSAAKRVAKKLELPVGVVVLTGP
jgi:hypothetical protein